MIVVKNGELAKTDWDETKVSYFGECGCDVDDCTDDGGCGCDN